MQSVKRAAKPIYFFDELPIPDKTLIGGKGAGLAAMTKIGLPVPAGFTIISEICEKYYEAGKRLPDGLMDEVREAIKGLEARTGRQFGLPDNPLLVSVRSGAAVSMPGMLDTVLNVGMNEEIAKGLARSNGNELFAWDTYRRFLQMFGKIVLGTDERLFETILQEHDLSDLESAKNLCHAFENLLRRSANRFPTDPHEQLRMAIEAVFDSWTGRRASEYRRRYGIAPAIANGTAVSIVTMVYGNLGYDSGTGVVSTRNPDTGHKSLYGDYLLNAQGEEVVSGKTNPRHIDTLEREMPEVFSSLMRVSETLENYFHEPQDIEFTIERKRLYLLQTRTAKMSALASIKTSVDMFHEGLIAKTAALERLNAEALEQILYPRIDPNSSSPPVATGVGASPGAASGAAIFDVAKAVSLGRHGEKIILVREETKPEDVPAFFHASGILTIRGGKTSHAAVVARGMGKPCVVGCSQLEFELQESKLTATLDDTRTISEGDKITIDGSTGRVYLGAVQTVDIEVTDELREILQWCSEMKGIKIRANADTPESAAAARKYGAEGIGLCRTERMFSQPERIAQIVRIIMAQNEHERRAALQQLEPLQRRDFKAILREMRGLPVTIRLLDPPLHEFLPDEEELLQQIYDMKSAGAPSAEILGREKILRRVRELSEINPMLGHRGVRVGVSFPEIYESQIRAVCEATAELANEGLATEPQIMVPQVAIVEELSFVRQIFESVKRDVETRHGTKLRVLFGSMIEVVRSCLVADELAQFSDFLSFGTNDLTQAAFSFSREDAESKFLPLYVDRGVMLTDPFETVDEKGVGRLMQMAVDLSRKSKRGMEIGICGEHGGDPRSIEFFSRIGLDYVSASERRIPIAIIAAAQSAIRKTSHQIKA